MKEYLAESSYILLHNLFRYCPVKETGEYICRLKEHGVYPIDGKGGIVRAMNVKWFWLLCCRVYHLIPASLRVRF